MGWWEPLKRAKLGDVVRAECIFQKHRGTCGRMPVESLGMSKRERLPLFNGEGYSKRGEIMIQHVRLLPKSAVPAGGDIGLPGWSLAWTLEKQVPWG